MSQCNDLLTAARQRSHTYILYPGVRPIAKWRLLRLLTTAECDTSPLLNMHLHGRKIRPGMGSVAKRLGL